MVALVAGAPDAASDRRQAFKEPLYTEGKTPARFGETSGGGRYQYWRASVDAAREHPLRGIGAGTFEFYWAQHASFTSHVRDAHSLYLETLGELGVVGLILVGGFVVLVLATGCFHAARAGPGDRELLAGATAACAAFAASAAFDWVWEMPILPVAFLIVGSVILAPRPRERPTSPTVDIALRVSYTAMSLCALSLVAVTLAGTSSIRDSREAVRDARLAEALRDARTAQRVQPYAATPRLQEALVLERAGDLRGAAMQARRAIDAEPVNWRTWLILARIEANRRRPSASVAAFRRARALNPRNPLFAQATGP